jgi:hypothetical protein
MNICCCFPHAEVSELADDVTSDGVWYDWIGCMICKLRFIGMVMCFDFTPSNTKVRHAIHNKQVNITWMGVVQLSF